MQSADRDPGAPRASLAAALRPALEKAAVIVGDTYVSRVEGTIDPMGGAVATVEDLRGGRGASRSCRRCWMIPCCSPRARARRRRARVRSSVGGAPRDRRGRRLAARRRAAGGDRDGGSARSGSRADRGGERPPVHGVPPAELARSRFFAPPAEPASLRGGPRHRRTEPACATAPCPPWLARSGDDPSWRDLLFTWPRASRPSAGGSRRWSTCCGRSRPKDGRRGCSRRWTIARAP